ncbi:MAG TPA: hypothetical protein VLD19_19470, partial [Chitinophagaceae bacterium]|nr:hypothetical protein [Chitinophagaceae bacterium]
MSGNNITSVKIRMYNTGSVGDCFLLLFQKGNTTSFSMMIDCGGIKTSSAAVTPCVEDIRQACNGKLDLLIVTHQHEDHLSGFNLARPVFDKITVNEVWMSWVENKDDPIAAILKKRYGKKLKELKQATEAAAKELKRHDPQNSEVAGLKKSFNSRMQGMQEALAALEFEMGASHGAGLAAGRQTNDDAMNYVKGKGKKLNYRLPGEVLKNIPGAEGMKFYVLGPPRDEDLKYLKIEMDENEMYKLAAAGLLPAVADDTDRLLQSGVILQKSVSPFGAEYALKGKDKGAFLKAYNSKDNKWRQIETDWLDAGTEVALALTKLTNNTSLALAIEFEGSGKVILLPADAQSGNWISWHRPEVMSSLKAKGGKDTDELLANTVFYKVGHHLSHNGTASKSGLDKMTRDGLVAFAPLVQDKVPAAWGGAANFPAKGLYKV